MPMAASCAKNAYLLRRMFVSRYTRPSGLIGPEGREGGGTASRRRPLAFEAEAHLQGDLKVSDLAVGDVTARFDRLEPVDVAQRLARSLDGIADRVVSADGR